MLILISPAKTLDFKKEEVPKEHSLPPFLDESSKLIERLRQFTPNDITSLMKVSEKLAHLNYERFQDWHIPFTRENAKAAIMAFTGDVYEGLNAREFNDDQFTYAQKHLRILSGLYGILKPLDLIQPYRLEMGTPLHTSRGNNLYQFWDNAITDAINESIKNEKEPVILNLASQEYFKSINEKELKARVITPVFKELRGDKYKIISFSAKRARGLMVNYIIKNKFHKAEAIKAFDLEGYSFNEALSSHDEFVFTRVK